MPIVVVPVSTSKVRVADPISSRGVTASASAETMLLLPDPVKSPLRFRMVPAFPELSVMLRPSMMRPPAPIVREVRGLPGPFVPPMRISAPERRALPTVQLAGLVLPGLLLIVRVPPPARVRAPVTVTCPVFPEVARPPEFWVKKAIVSSLTHPAIVPPLRVIPAVSAI